MRIFVTGATGFIGSILVPELIKSGNKVVGLTRSAEGAVILRGWGAESHFGDVEDLESLREGAAKSDGVIHLAFNHNFAQFQKSSEDDRKAVETIGEALVGTNRPFIMTSPAAVAMSVDGTPVTEESPLAPWNPRTGSEAVMKALTDRGVNTSVVRLPQVHDTHKQGIVTSALQVARATGQSAYIADGSNRWSAAHVSDVARLYRLAFEKGEPGSIYHAIGEEGVSIKAIAEALSRGLKVPVKSIALHEAEAHFGWLAMFMGLDLSASSTLTQQKLNWTPTGPELLADLDAMDYSQA